MTFTELSIAGAFVVELEPFADDRGFFARTFCEREFAEHGLETRVAQCSLSRNARRGILRGLHYQASPHGETKLVRCTAGAIFDVIVDMRCDRSTYRQWAAVELSQANARALYIPKFVAHGFQVLTDQADVLYQMSEFHHPESARGLRWNDPGIAIPWPILPPLLSQRDAEYPDFNWAGA